MTGPHSNDSILHADGHPAARDPHGEPLSAMMDGTLSDDESRFLLRRMQHDAELAGRWERWQFYGDAMRGSAGRALPADFNRRIALAIAAEHDAAGHDDLALDAVAGDPRGRAGAMPQHPATVSARRPLLRWGGGAALAASVAFAAIVGLRPDAAVSPGGAPPASGSALVGASSAQVGASAAQVGASAASGAATVASSSSPLQMPDTSSAALDASTGSAPVALASTPRPAAESPLRAQRAPGAERGSDEAAPAPRVLVARSVDAAGPARVPDLRAGFGDAPAGDDLPLIAKPWPRSPLLQGRGDGEVMVDYGQGFDGRGLILGRPVQPPRSGSPLSSPSIFVRPADASGAAQDPSTAPAAAPGTADGAEPPSSASSASPDAAPR